MAQSPAGPDPDRDGWLRPGPTLGGPIEEIRPDEKHWHGATATTAMTYIAIQEHLDGKTADWMEQVSDVQYQA